MNKAECTGCSSCASICPKTCISMEVDSEGFCYPNVDVERCISCNLCVKVCPIKFPVVDKRKPLKTLAAISKDALVRSVSSSGGIFSLLATMIVENGGKVWGAIFDENWRVIHQGIDKDTELHLFLGAKYLQSDLQHTFNEIENYLKNGKSTLFSGTPCQVAGLKRYLRKDYEYLYTVDIVCHGVPSYKVFESFLLENFGDRRILDIAFRNKATGWRTYNLYIKYMDDGIIKEKRFLRKDNVYLDGFISNLYLRPSCYQCPAKCGTSGSDITLGDFWGIEKQAPEMDDRKGTSLVLLNTLKGEKVFDMISPFVLSKEMLYDIAYMENISLELPPQMNPWRNIFFKDIKCKPFSTVVRSFDSPSLYLRLRRKINNLMKLNV